MRSSRFAKSGLGIPYALFLLLFVVAPLFVLLYYAFTNGQGQFTVQNLAAFFTSPNTIGVPHLLTTAPDLRPSVP